MLPREGGSAPSAAPDRCRGRRRASRRCVRWQRDLAARLAQHRGVDLDVAVHAEDDVGEVERDAHQGVLAALAAGARTAAALASGGAEERLEDVAEPAEAAGAAGTRRRRHVVARALLGVLGAS